MPRDVQARAVPAKAVLVVHTTSSLILVVLLFLAADTPPLFLSALVVQLALPWVLVGYVGFLPTQLTFGVSRAVTDAPSSLAAALLANMWANLAVFAALRYVEVTKHSRLVEYSLGLASLLVGAMILVDRRGERRWSWAAFIFVCLTSLIYGYAAAAWINAVLDRSPEVVVSSIVEKKFHFYKGGLQVRIRPWEFVTEAKAFEVPHAIFKSLVEGGPVCMVTRTGTLGIPWYTAQVCPGTDHRITLGGADLWWMRNDDNRSSRKGGK